MLNTKYGDKKMFKDISILISSSPEKGLTNFIWANLIADHLSMQQTKFADHRSIGS